MLENGYLKRFYDLTSELNKLNLPTLIVHGDKDLFPLWTAKEIKSNIPNAKSVVLKNCGHFSYIEKPKETFDAIRKFCQKWSSLCENQQIKNSETLEVPLSMS